MHEIIREDGPPGGVSDEYRDGNTVQEQRLHDVPLRVAEEPNGVQVLKVSARSQPSQLAGAIAGVLRSGDIAQLQAIGAGAVNQAVKAIATARVYLESDDIDLMCVPSFTQVELEGERRTAISIRVEQF